MNREKRALYIMLLSWLLLAIWLSVPVFAVEFPEPPEPSVLLTWSLPKTDTNGDTITVKTVYVGYGLVSEVGVATVLDLEAPDTSYNLIPETGAGTYHARIIVVDTNDVQSQWSNQTTFVFTDEFVRPDPVDDLDGVMQDNVALHIAIDDCIEAGTCVADINLIWGN